MVGYNFNGSWSYTLKKYTENNMPADVRDIVKSTFFDYAIMGSNRNRGAAGERKHYL
jgi:hypothetical protein